jgi:hypothetical protein
MQAKPNQAVEPTPNSFRSYVAPAIGRGSPPALCVKINAGGNYMPRQEHVFSVFVASPGDVENERDGLEEIIRELNIAWSRELGIRLELIRWETHAYPGIGEDAQSVINEQIPTDYDLFIGIMWCRYGTPTGRAGSGTIEEFQLAKSRYDKDPAGMRLMFYFKDTPVPPSKLDPDQLAKVAAFRKSLGNEGVLYWTFDGLEDFDKHLRLHITRQVQAWHNQLKNPQTEVTVSISKGKALDIPTSPTDILDADEDLGLLDLSEIFEESFHTLTDITLQIATSTRELGGKIEAHSQEINELVTTSQGNVDRKVAKRLITRAASDMDQYVARMEAELPLFGQNLDKGMQALIRAAMLSVEFETTDAEQGQAREGLQAILAFRDTLSQTELHIQEFRTTVAGLPRMTSTLNKSKRQVVSVLDQLIEKLESGQSLSNEAEQLMRTLLGASQDE